MNRVIYKECRETKGAMGFIELGLERDLAQYEGINEAWAEAKHRVREELDQAIREAEAEKRMKGEEGPKISELLRENERTQNEVAILRARIRQLEESLEGDP